MVLNPHPRPLSRTRERGEPSPSPQALCRKRVGSGGLADGVASGGADEMEEAVPGFGVGRNVGAGVVEVIEKGGGRGIASVSRRSEALEDSMKRRGQCFGFAS